MKRSLKALVVGPANPDSFADNILDSLTFMGHQARPDYCHSTFSRLFCGRTAHRLNDVSRHFGHTIYDSLVVKSAVDFQPDLVIFPTFNISHRALHTLKERTHAKLVAWWGDTPGNLRGLDLLSDAWDAIFLKDHTCVAKMKLLKLPAHHLPEAMNPRWHRPAPVKPSNEVVIAGNYYGFRQALISRLSAHHSLKLALYGPSPPRWSLRSVKDLHRNEYIARTRKSEVFCAAAACLNTVSFAENDSINCRAFEIAGARGLHVSEFRERMCEYFEPQREVLMFTSLDELVQILERAVTYPSEFDRVREGALQRAIAHHTYEHRLTQLLECVF